MTYDYSKLLGKITEVFGTREKFSKAMGLSKRTMSLKLNAKVGWKQAEIMQACELLNIAECDIHDYFFNLKV